MLCHVCEGPWRQFPLDLVVQSSRILSSMAQMPVCPNVCWEQNVAGAPGFISAETEARTGGSIFMLPMLFKVQLRVIIEQQL